jgi:RNA polymerase sigma factor (sigma-70 family)
MDKAALQKIIIGCISQKRKDQRLLYRQYYNLAIGICLRYTEDREEASLRLNEGYLKIYSILHMYQTTEPFEGWFYRHMLDSVINYYTEKRIPDMASTVFFQDTNSSHSWPKNLNYNQLLAALHSLDTFPRLVYNLYVIERYDVSRISSLLTIGSGDVLSYLAAARFQLRIFISQFK